MKRSLVDGVKKKKVKKSKQLEHVDKKLEPIVEELEPIIEERGDEDKIENKIEEDDSVIKTFEHDSPTHLNDKLLIWETKCVKPYISHLFIKEILNFQPISVCYSRKQTVEKMMNSKNFKETFIEMWWSGNVIIHKTILFEHQLMNRMLVHCFDKKLKTKLMEIVGNENVDQLKLKAGEIIWKSFQ